MKVSQSLIKSWDEYCSGETCGSIIEAKYLTKEWDRTWDDSDSKALGRYFEFLLNGEKPTGYDQYPEPQWMKSATEEDKNNLNIEKMLAPYRLVHYNAGRVIELLDASGFIIERSQVYHTRDMLEGTIDVEAIYRAPRGGRERKVNIDIKYSGLMNDKWSKFGWQWSDIQKKYNAIQAAQYQLLNDRVVFFLVCSSTNDKDLEIFEMKIERDYMRKHIATAEEIIERVDFMKQVGWIDYPSLTKCSQCPLVNCKSRVSKLVPTKIEIE